MDQDHQYRNRFAGYRNCIAGAAAIESALVLPVLIVCLLAILQFSLTFTTKDILNSAVYNLANSRAAPVLTKSQAEVVEEICTAIPYAPDCKGNILVEIAPIGLYDKNNTTIFGTLYQQGVAGDTLMMRARLKVASVIPGAGDIYIEGAAIFTRQ